MLFLCVNFIENLYRFIKSYSLSLSPSLGSISSNSLRIDNINNALFNVLAQHTRSLTELSIRKRTNHNRKLVVFQPYFILFYFIIVLFCLSSIERLSFILSHLFFLLFKPINTVANTIYNNGLQFIIYLWQQSNLRKRQTNQSKAKQKKEEQINANQKPCRHVKFITQL